MSLREPETPFSGKLIGVIFPGKIPVRVDVVIPVPGKDHGIGRLHSVISAGIIGKLILSRANI
jgi:hypothetical protein